MGVWMDLERFMMVVYCSFRGLGGIGGSQWEREIDI